MVSLTTPICDFGAQAPNFKLLGVDGKEYSLADCAGDKGLVVVFACNHCPYVKAIQPRLVRDANALRAHGINMVMISSNDAEQFPDDSYENMQITATEQHYPFPYLYDPTQEVAQAFGAICTPDFFGYNKELSLQYRGRLDASRKETAPEDTPRELYEAMVQVAQTGKGPEQQTASMGCSIKWLSTFTP